MSRSKKLTNELDTLQTRKVFQLFMTESAIFKGWGKEDINSLADHATVLKIFPNDRLVRKGEIVSWWGMLLNGSAFITTEFLKLGKLGSGDMIGYMGFLDLKGNQFHKFDITVEQPGYIAVIFKEDVKILQKKFPKLVYKLYQLLGLKSLDVIYYLITSKSFNKQVKFRTADYTMKRKSDLVSKIPKLQLEFVSYLDKTEQKIFYTLAKVINLDPKEILIEANAIEPAIFMVLSGTLIEFRAEESKFIKEGAGIGYSQFISTCSGCVWPHNVGSLDYSMILMIHKDDFQDAVTSAPVAAANIFKLFVQLFSKKLVDDKFADSSRDSARNLFIRNSYIAGVQDFIIELDASKQTQKNTEIRRMKSEEFKSVESVSLFDEYTPSVEYPPLFHFNKFKDQLDLSIKKGSVIYIQEIIESIFILEKLERQRVEKEEAKKARRSAVRRRPGMSPKKKEESKTSKFERTSSKTPKRKEDYKKELQKTEGLYIDMGAEYDEILEENQLIKSEAEKLRKEIDNLKKENSKLQDALKEQKIDKQILEVK